MKKQHLGTSILLLILVSISQTTFAQSPVSSNSGERRVIDFRYAPGLWFSNIGFPEDGHKAVANEFGGLVYDFGPGPYNRPTTSVTVGAKDVSFKRDRQFLDDARVPIVRTDFHAENATGATLAATLYTETFSIVPNFALKAKTDPRFQRIEGINGSLAYATPPADADEAFRSVAWGTNRPILYEIQVPKGASQKVVMGFCEPYRNQPRGRMMEVVIEGAISRQIDLIADAGGKQNTPVAYVFEAKDENQDGILKVTVNAVPDVDPNIHLSAIWMFPSSRSFASTTLINPHFSDAELTIDAGIELENLPARIDAIRATYQGTSVTPQVFINTRRLLQFDANTGIMAFHARPFITTKPKAISAEKTDNGWVLTLPAGTKQVEVFAGEGQVAQNVFSTLPRLSSEITKSKAYWLRQVFPFGKFQTPDPQINRLITSSIRTIYQNREILNGKPRYQIGPSVYRGLWLGDGWYMAETMAQLGDMKRFKEMIDLFMTYQKPDGEFQFIHPVVAHREDFNFMWLMCRYASISQDWAWLREHWSAMSRALKAGRNLRNQTLKDGLPYYGLIPPSFTDGGISGEVAEYTSVHWALISLPQVAEIADKLGETADAAEARSLYQDFFKSYHAARKRDMRKDEFGNWYLPVPIGTTTPPNVPTKGQWTMGEAMIYGSFLAPHDSLAVGTVNMMAAHSVEGMPHSIAWLDGGVWTTQTGFLADMNNLQGNPERANDLMNAYANHAAPVGTWAEEQMPAGSTRTGGDFPDGWESSNFIRATMHLVAFEYVDQLLLFNAMPLDWLNPNAKLVLDKINMKHGQFSLNMQVSPNGKRVSIIISSRPHANEPAPIVAKPITLNLKRFKEAGFSTTADSMSLNWGETLRLTLTKK
jgi:hypothetical protein